MREADRGRVVKPSTRTVAQFFAEWFAAIEPIDRCHNVAELERLRRTYVIPRIGGERLQRLDEPQLLELYGKLLAEGRVKRDRNSEMYAYWADRSRRAKTPRLVRFPTHVRRRSTQREQRFGGTGPASFQADDTWSWRPKRCATSTR